MPPVHYRLAWWNPFVREHGWNVYSSHSSIPSRTGLWLWYTCTYICICNLFVDIHRFLTGKDPQLQYRSKVTHVPRTSYALDLQYMNGRHTCDKRVRSAHPTRVMLPEQHPAHIPRRCCTHDARFMCSATLESQMRCKRRRKCASYALHPAWEVRFLAWVTFGQYCMTLPWKCTCRIRWTSGHWKLFTFITKKYSNVQCTCSLEPRVSSKYTPGLKTKVVAAYSGHPINTLRAFHTLPITQLTGPIEFHAT
jgi:hypothetical protein